MNDTICSIATNLGIGAISIIRVSGNNSIKIVNEIFKGKDLEKVLSHTIHYGYIIDNDEIIDEVLVSVMKKPKTYTTEDVVEINCHGGIETTNKILEILLLQGCRLAEPGEFTKRAFLNGRIDLMQAEAVADLINSKTDKARKVAINSLKGNGSKLIKELRKTLIEIISNIEVNIDYPEYEDIYEVTNQDLKIKIIDIKNKLTKKYQKNINKEIMQGMTLIGLHRDDLCFKIKGFDARIYASEGQQKILMIAYKISELLLFKKIKNEYPVLLLDDVFSEIDLKKRNNIIKYFPNDIQVIITTNDINNLNGDLVSKAQIYKIKNGTVKIKGGVKNVRRKSR